jgi:hypothetical protein
VTLAQDTLQTMTTTTNLPIDPDRRQPLVLQLQDNDGSGLATGSTTSTLERPDLLISFLMSVYCSGYDFAIR